MWRCRRIIGIIITIIAVVLVGCDSRTSIILEGARNNNLDNEIILLPESVPTSDEIQFNLEGQLYQLINDYRQVNGLAPLKWSPSLERCAEVRAEEASDYWSHTRPSGEPWYTVDPKIMRGENLAQGLKTANDILNAWIDSPSHNELLLADDFEYVAIAGYTDYYACEFC